MRVRLHPLLLALAMAAAPAARAAEGLEARRAEVGSAVAALEPLKAEQQARRDELAALSRRIDALKAQGRGRLLPGGELDRALKRSQELSAGLTSLTRALDRQSSELEAARTRLVEALGAELKGLAGRFDGRASREERAALVSRLRELRAEREAVRATLPPAALPDLAPPAASDDPVELLAQADQARDAEERARRELHALEGRLAERRQEQELDRRVQRFLGEESMFDDQDRRLRVQRQESTRSDVAGAFGAGSLSTGLQPTNADPASAPLPGTAGTVSGADARPQPGAPTGLGGDEDELKGLERQRAALERLAKELGQRAEALTRRAAELR